MTVRMQALEDGRTQSAQQAPATTHSVDGDGIWLEVQQERVRAHAKHGVTSMESASAFDPTGRRLRILLEEVGEVAQEFNDAEHEHRAVDPVRLRTELIQVAAMAGAWADSLGHAIRAEGIGSA